MLNRIKLPKLDPLILLIIAGHVFLSLHAATRLSPTWDEIAYPAAGLTQLKTGEIRLNTVNPFLSKVISAVPLVFLNPELPLDDSSWAQADGYRFGFKFTFRNTTSPHLIIFLSRLPVVLFSLLTVLILMLWIKKLWGPKAGAIAVLCYASTPILLSRAAVAQLEMPVYFFILLALWFHVRWMQTERIPFLIAAGAMTGLACSGKLIALPLLPLFAILNLFFFSKEVPLLRRIAFIVLVIGAAALTILMAYLPWKGGWLAFKDIIDNLIHFDSILPFYWHGKTWQNINSLISLGAFFIKAPLHVVFLGVFGGVIWFKSGKERLVFWHAAGLALFPLLTVLFFKHAVSTIQLSPVYLGLIFLSGALFFKSIKNNFLMILISGAMLLGTWDVLRVHPNYLSYFNFIAGGSDKGYLWLADSDQDWGQSLPALSSAIKKYNNPGLVLCYSGSADPDAYGITYQDLYSPALVSRDRKQAALPPETERVLLAIGTKIFQSQPALFNWILKNRPPIDIIGSTFFIYDISNDAPAYEWMSNIYTQTNRPALAEAAARRAEALLKT